jgi:hypothetical protein
LGLLASRQSHELGFFASSEMQPLAVRPMVAESDVSMQVGVESVL